MPIHAVFSILPGGPVFGFLTGWPETVRIVVDGHPALTTITANPASRWRWRRRRRARGLAAARPST